jgi:hypothetical protein
VPVRFALQCQGAQMRTGVDQLLVKVLRSLGPWFPK